MQLNHVDVEREPAVITACSNLRPPLCGISFVNALLRRSRAKLRRASYTPVFNHPLVVTILVVSSVLDEKLRVAHTDVFSYIELQDG